MESQHYMDAETVLATARSGIAPQTWTILPLQRAHLRRSVLNWGLLSGVGFILLIPAFFATVPSNFQAGRGSSVVTGALLLILGAVAFGSLGIALYDWFRLQHAEDYLIVITPDDYVKAERGRITHVPMEYISYITLRGIKIPTRETDNVRDPVQGIGMGPIGVGSFNRMLSTRPRREMKSAPSLAFVDTRNDKVVVVATDDSFGDLPSLERLIQINSDAKERSRRS